MTVKLTSMVKTSGCAAKLAPGVLHKVLDSLPRMECPSLLEGFANSDDALVYRVKDDLMCIETVDFFPPMVDDPFAFGQVAAANALSDVYAMGADPSVAMNLVCIPSCLDSDVMRQILLGGQSKVSEAGAVIAGGHTIADPTPKYGLCVTGFARESEIWRNGGARVGDALVLTKAIGVGVINTAVKADFASEESARAAVASMTTLNKRAKDSARSLDVHGATDVTGFSLLGHSLEMAQASGVSLEIDFASVPLLEGVLELASLGMLPEGVYSNRDYLAGQVGFEGDFLQCEKDILYDPQTSGGLLLALPAADAEILVKRLSGSPAAIIGRVTARGGFPVVVRKA